METRLCTLMLGCFQGFLFWWIFALWLQTILEIFQIFSVNSKTNCQTFKTHKIDKKKTLVASSFFSSFHFLSNNLQIYYIPFFMPDKMEGMSQIEGQVTPTYPWLASPSHREQPPPRDFLYHRVNAQQLQQPPMCQLSSGGTLEILDVGGCRHFTWRY